MPTDLSCQCYKKRLPLKGNIINILISGVGGQGILLASEIVAETFVKAGYDVKESSAHGMAQRGGSITSHIRIGEKIYSPLISKGEANILIAMELTEAYRSIEYLRKDGLIILLDREIYPGIVTSGPYKYPKDLKSEIRKRRKRVLEISYGEIVKDLENIKTTNMFMLGVLSNHFSVKKVYWLKTIREKVPSQMRNLNLTAFQLGRRKFPKDACGKLNL